MSAALQTTRTARSAEPTGLLEVLRTDWASYRARRATRARLDAELASYRTPSEIEDLLATLDRGEGADVEYMRTVLGRNLARFHSARDGRLGFLAA